MATTAAETGGGVMASVLRYDIVASTVVPFGTEPDPSCSKCGEGLDSRKVVWVEASGGSFAYCVNCVVVWLHPVGEYRHEPYGTDEVKECRLPKPEET